MARPALGKVDVMVRLNPKLLARIDAVAKRCRMNRSEFIAMFLETTLEQEEPFIDFALALGRMKASLVWPKWKPGSARA